MRFTSIKSVIAKLFRDFNVRTTDFIGYAHEWAGEALDRIGYQPVLVDKERILKVENHRARIPYDLERIDVIYIADEDATEDTPKEEYTDIIEFTGSNFNSTLHSDLALNKTVGNKYDEGYYQINGNFINLSYEQRFILVLYKGFPLDDEGFPIIVDTTRVKEAVTQYIVFKMMSRGWKHPAQINFFQQKNEWEESCVRARANILMPDKEAYRRFEDSWVTLLPNVRADNYYSHRDTYKQVTDPNNLLIRE